MTEFFLSENENDEQCNLPSKEERILGLLSYFPFGFAIILFIRRATETDKVNSLFVQQHLKIGTLFFFGTIVLCLIAWWIAFLIYVFLAGVGIFYSYQGKLYPFSDQKSSENKTNNPE
jgi:hypothetical protein